MRAQSPARSKSRADIEARSSMSLESLQGTKKENALSFESVEQLSFERCLEDTPEIREQLRAASISSENAAVLLKQVTKKAQALRDALKIVDKERQALVATIRQLEVVGQPEGKNCTLFFFILFFFFWFFFKKRHV
jgi:hypothetical protein